MSEHHLLLNECLCSGVLFTVFLLAAVTVLVGCALSEVPGAGEPEICSQLSAPVLDNRLLNSSQNKGFKLGCQTGQGSDDLGHLALLLSGLLLPLEDMASYPKTLQRTFSSDSQCLVLKY